MMGLSQPVENRLHARFTDADADLVADPPGSPDDWLDPPELAFSYVSSAQGDEGYPEVWQEFVEHLAQATGKPVRYLQLGSQDEQLRALKTGALHIAGLNTGSVPIAVNDCGFVPICTPGNQDGRIDYVMQLLVRADSPIQNVRGLRSHTLTLSDRNSNSGFKAPLTLLMSDFGLQVERDYLVRMSFSQDASIRGVASGRYEAVAVASDLVKRAVERGHIKPDQFRVLYESEPFVAAAIGYLHNLKPELADAVRQACFDFEWAGTRLEKEYASIGADRFVPVNYKNDWSIVRRIDDAVGYHHSVELPGTKENPAPPAEAESS
jgi:phosphonate transport system substrate-binding protein